MVISLHSVSSIVSGLFGRIDVAGMGSDQLLFTIVQVSLHSKENGFLNTIQSASSFPIGSAVPVAFH